MRTAVAPVLAAWWSATGRHAALWAWWAADRPPTLVAATRGDAAVAAEPPADAPGDLVARSAERGWTARCVGEVAPALWLVVENPAPEDGAPLRHEIARDTGSGRTDATLDDLLAQIVRAVAGLVRERDGATAELAERYEEISLLYSIGELLGGSTSVEAVADTVLRELAVTVGAPRGAVMLHDAARGTLESIALLGLSPDLPTSVAVDDPVRLVARVFREGATLTLPGGEATRRGLPLLAPDGGPVLLVPVTRTERGGGEALGVLLLAGRPGDPPFTAGDRKLVTAVATQVGTALHNARLVRAALEQEQLAREMRLASELQLTLLPNPRAVAPEAHAVARVVPAEHVGGDFYLLVRLDADRTGVLIGDVSGHGYRAALVMALAMSAAAIHVQAVRDPAIALGAIADSIADELERTDMSIALFYGVIDERRGLVRWANAGHPHAFVLHADGRAERLGAQGPPLGFGVAPVQEASCPWRPDDRLLLFTDGVADLRDPADTRLGEAAVLAVAAEGADAPLAAVLEALLARVDAHAGGVPLRDDLAIVLLERSARAVSNRRDGVRDDAREDAPDAARDRARDDALHGGSMAGRPIATR